jgi:hypothetical protein
MGREMKPLFTGDALEPIPAGLEILMVEATLRYEPSLCAWESEECHLSSWLVALEPSVAQRRAARAMAAGLVAARTSFHQTFPGVSLDTWLPDLLLQNQGLIELCLVISVPAHNLQLQAQIEQFIGQLRLSPSHSLEHVVCVSPRASDWQKCNAFTGHVECAASELNATAFKVFHLLNALQAPGLMSALDAEDYRDKLGTAMRPATLVDAVWTLQDKVLVLGCQDDRQFLTACKGLVVMPCQELHLRQLADLHLAVRQCTVDSCYIVIAAPYDQHTQATASSEIAPVILLCSEFFEADQS